MVIEILIACVNVTFLELREYRWFVRAGYIHKEMMFPKENSPPFIIVPDTALRGHSIVLARTTYTYFVLSPLFPVLVLRKGKAMISILNLCYKNDIYLKVSKLIRA